jgi:tetratricopeptide (TPR) repeat protein
MTDQPLNPPPSGQPSLEERIEIIASELELAIKWQRPCVVFAVYSSEYVRADVQAALANQLIDLGQETVAIHAQGIPPTNVVQQLEGHLPSTQRVFFVEHLSSGQTADALTYTSLDSRRDFFRENNIRAVFWLTQNELVELSRRASDFWAFRQCVVEFADAPRVEQVLGQELEAAWQCSGESLNRLEPADELPAPPEGPAAGLTQEREATAACAKTLLTLGILSWRKGDFEKANEHIQQALQTAELIQDNWFEAECFNAIALLRSSMGRHEDAIEAYKQAIQLAPAQIFAWNNLGNLCARIGRNDEALVTFIKALECNSKDPIAWNGLGNVYQKLGYPEDAISAYRKSIKAMPTFAYPWNGLGDALASLDRNEDAIKAYQQATQLNCWYVMPWLNLGKLFTRIGRRRDAMKALHRAAALDARNSPIWNEIGAAYMNDGALDKAAEAFTKAIEIDRANGWAHSNLGLVLSQQDKPAESLPLLIRAVELLKQNKDKALALNRLGDAYRQLNEYENAVKTYEAADRLKRDLPLTAEVKVGTQPAVKVAAAVAEVQTEIPSTEETKETAPEAMAETAAPQAEQPEENPPESNDAPQWLISKNSDPTSSAEIQEDDPSLHGNQPMTTLVQHLQPAKFSTDRLAEAIAYNSKGNEFFRQGEYEAAIGAYNRAIQFDPSLGWPYSNLAQIYVMQNQFAEAILLYQKSIELLDTNKDKAICWNNLGNVYRCLNDYDNAIAAYQKASELDPATAGMREGTGAGTGEAAPKNARAWNDMGDAFLKSGSFKEAIVAFKKAVELNPEFAEAYGNHALALTLQGKYADAVPLYQRAIDLIPSDKDKVVWLNRLGNAYRKLNDYDNAINSFRDAMTKGDERANLVSRVRFSLLSNCATD